jgi:MoxR-like ATPase
VAALGCEPARGDRHGTRRSRARLLDGRDFVIPEDVQSIAPDALRHRLLLDYGAQARGITTQTCIEELLRRVPAP